MEDDTRNIRTKLLTCAQAADYAGVTVRKIRSARASGALVGHLPRGCQRGWRYLVEDLDAWLMGETVRPAAQARG